MSKIDELKKGQKVAGTAIWLEGILVAAKIIIGLLSQSIVLISDAIHSASSFLFQMLFIVHLIFYQL